MAKANAISGDNGANDFVILHIQKGDVTAKNSQPLRGLRLGPRLGPGGKSLHGGLFSFGGAEVQHKAVVEPVFFGLQPCLYRDKTHFDAGSYSSYSVCRR